MTFKAKPANVLKLINKISNPFQYNEVVNFIDYKSSEAIMECGL